MHAKHAKICCFCHFYAEIVKFGLILTHLTLCGGKLEGGKIFLGKMPPVPRCGAASTIWIKWLGCRTSTVGCHLQTSVCRLYRNMIWLVYRDTLSNLNRVWHKQNVRESNWELTLACYANDAIFDNHACRYKHSQNPLSLLKSQGDG